MNRNHSQSLSSDEIEADHDAAPSQVTPSGGLFYDDDGVVHELARPTVPPPVAALG